MKTVLCSANLATSAVAQTSDAGADQALSTSLSATAKAMHTSIRRNLADAAESMPAEQLSRPWQQTDSDDPRRDSYLQHHPQ
jgi:hypothetical protein